MAEARPSLGRQLAWRLEAFAYDAAAGLARLFPVDAVSDFGAWLLGTLGPLSPKARIAETNLRIAFPDAPDAEIARLLDAQWRELGRWLAEFPIMDRIAGDPSRIEVVHRERLTRLGHGEGPAVLISGHFSNFEVMAAAIVQAGVPCQVTYRAFNNPYMDERVREGRFRYGVRLFAPKGLKGGRELMRAIARGESIAIMNDQKFNTGVEAPLFGVTAHTADGPSTYALRFGIPIQPMSVQRTHKARFRVVVHEPIVLEATGDRDADIAAGVRRVNAFVEARVRERPSEWFWTHRRWPNEHYRKSKRRSA